MKRSVFIVGVFTSAMLALSAPLVAQDLTAQAWKPGDMHDAAMLRRVSLSLENARTSDQLLALSKASDLSIFADATLFSATSPPVSLKVDNSVRNWILESASQEGLSWRRADERIWLFWKEPDAPAVVKSLIAEIKAGKPNQTAEQAAEEATRRWMTTARATLRTRSQEAELFFANYLQQERGWDGQSPLHLEFKLSELPSQSATELLSIARSYPRLYKKYKQQSWMEDANWLSDETWQSARLLYSQPPGGLQPILAVQSTKGNSQFFSALENLKIPLLPVTTLKEKGPIPLAGTAIEAITNVSAEELSREDALAPPISLEVKEIPLRDLLLEMQKQGGVTLNMAPGLLSYQRVTVRTSALPLHQTMKALSELYGTSWAKAPDGSYLMQSGLSPALARALQVGDPNWFAYWRSDAGQKPPPERLILPPLVDWQSELLKANIGEAALRVPNGVAISSLPAGSQGLIRRVVEERYAVELMRQYGDAFASSDALREGHESEVMVRVSPRVAPPAPLGASVPRRSNAPILEVTLIEGGKAVHSFYVHGPQARKGIEETLRRDREMQDRMQQIPAQQPAAQ